MASKNEHKANDRAKSAASKELIVRNKGIKPSTHRAFIDTSYEWFIYFSKGLNVESADDPTTGRKGYHVSSPDKGDRLVIKEGVAPDGKRRAVYVVRVKSDDLP